MLTKARNLQAKFFLTDTVDVYLQTSVVDDYNMTKQVFTYDRTISARMMSKKRISTSDEVKVGHTILKVKYAEEIPYSARILHNGVFYEINVSGNITDMITKEIPLSKVQIAGNLT